MSNKSVMGLGQAHELDLALARNKWTAEDVKLLSEGGRLAQFREVIRGKAQIVSLPEDLCGGAGGGPYRGGRCEESGKVIDCSADPDVTDGWSVMPGDQIASRFTGRLVWTPDAVGLHSD